MSICLDSVAEDYFDIYIPSYDMLFVAFSETDLELMMIPLDSNLSIHQKMGS